MENDMLFREIDSFYLWSQTSYSIVAPLRSKGAAMGRAK